jgi:hypothetical protein
VSIDTIFAATVSALATIAAAWIASRPARRGTSETKPSSGDGLWVPTSDTDSPSGDDARRRGRRRTAALGAAVDAGIDALWRIMERIPSLKRRTRPWLAATLGFFFSGFGIGLYFRTLPDVLVAIVLALPFAYAGSQLPDESEQAADASLPWWVWVFAALTGLYGFLRAASSNRRLVDAEGPASGGST